MDFKEEYKFQNGYGVFVKRTEYVDINGEELWIVRVTQKYGEEWHPTDNHPFHYMELFRLSAGAVEKMLKRIATLKADENDDREYFRDKDGRLYYQKKRKERKPKEKKNPFDAYFEVEKA